MRIQKQYACDYCDTEFDTEKECLYHESNCVYDSSKKKCASCSKSKAVRHYEVDYFICNKLLSEEYGCDNWCNK